GIEYRVMDDPTNGFLVLHRRHPRIHFGARNAHEAARHGQPDDSRVVFKKPSNRVTRQSVPAVQCGHTTVSHPAEATVRAGPHGTGGIEPKMTNGSVRGAVARCVGHPDAVAGEIRDAAAAESEPYACTGGVCGDGRGRVLMPQFGPGDWFDLRSTDGNAKQA